MTESKKAVNKWLEMKNIYVLTNLYKNNHFKFKL